MKSWTGEAAVDMLPSSGSEKKMLKVIQSLSDLFTRALEYRDYRLDEKSTRQDFSVGGKIHRMRKQLEVQMKTHSFSGRDRIAVLRFVLHFKTACNHSGAIGGAAVCCLQLYMTGQTHALLRS